MNKKIDKLLIVLSLAFVLCIVVLLYIFPGESQRIANSIFGFLTKIFGSLTLILGFAGVVLLFAVALSKYGKIKLTDEEPEYSTFKWVAMMISCGLGSATVYWAFAEWAYYIKTPGLSIATASSSAYEMAIPYTMFHWGFTAWALYALVGLPLCYHFYIRKNPGLSLSSMVNNIFHLKEKNIFAKIIDILFIFICFGGLSITLGVSVPLVTKVLCHVVGIQYNFIINIILILIISVVYSLSSYVGLQKGMSKISNANTKLAIAFIVALVILGPGLFIIGSMTNAFGLMLQNFIQMSFFTDPINNSGFPQSWTIFYWLYWITYAPFTGVFIAKVSKGRTLRSVIINTIISGSAGCFAFFGIIGSLALHRDKTGLVNVVDMVNNGQGNESIIAILETLPLGSIFMIIFCIMSILFLATTLDGAALTMATTATKGLKDKEEPHPMHRLFWCITLALVPLTMILIGADLNTIKTCAIITGIPIMFVMIIMVVGWLKWMKEDKNNREIIYEKD